VLPIVAGPGNILQLLTSRDASPPPAVLHVLPLRAPTFMLFAWVIEMAARLIVRVRPQGWPPVVPLWLFGIIVNLLLASGMMGVKFYDIALRDFGLLLGAVALARLSREFGGFFDARS